MTTVFVLASLAFAAIAVAVTQVVLAAAKKNKFGIKYKNPVNAKAQKRQRRKKLLRFCALCVFAFAGLQFI